MSVLINSNGSTPQPANDGLKEERIQVQHDNAAIDLSMQRDRTGEKKQATLNWNNLNATDYQLLIGFFTAGTTVTYSNSASDYTGGTFSFTGLPTFTEYPYVPGISLLRPLTAVIREV